MHERKMVELRIVKNGTWKKIWTYGIFNPPIDPIRVGINHFKWNTLTGKSRNMLLFVTYGI